MIVFSNCSGCGLGKYDFSGFMVNICIRLGAKRVL